MIWHGRKFKRKQSADERLREAKVVSAGKVKGHSCSAKGKLSENNGRILRSVLLMRAESPRCTG
ncbi:hypothetical protein CPC08DRAFT_714095 [Agrocybe pediades]|nr:hypothetical protein CPC08DRAFT_714095 [Agrocybe pediades]